MQSPKRFFWMGLISFVLAVACLVWKWDHVCQVYQGAKPLTIDELAAMGDHPAHEFFSIEVPEIKSTKVVNVNLKRKDISSSYHYFMVKDRAVLVLFKGQTPSRKIKGYFEYSNRMHEAAKLVLSENPKLNIAPYCIQQVVDEEENMNYFMLSVAIFGLGGLVTMIIKYPTLRGDRFGRETRHDIVDLQRAFRQ